MTKKTWSIVIAIVVIVLVILWATGVFGGKKAPEPTATPVVTEAPAAVTDAPATVTDAPATPTDAPTTGG